MLIKQALFDRIVAKAEEVLAADQKDLPQEAARTDQQKALDKFFSTSRFCDHHNAVVELVGILTGYTPRPVCRPISVQFRIVYCQKNRAAWMLLNNGTGFAQLTSGHYVNQSDCERLATAQEARQFLDNFKKLNADEFINWCKAHMQSTSWLLEL